MFRKLWAQRRPNRAQQATPLLVFLLLMLLTVSAFTQSVPQNINFQGRLARPDATPVADTNSQALIFRLYSALSGGNLLWQQVSNNVAVRNGTFAVPFNFAN